jgi:hypothetical protein
MDADDAINSDVDVDVDVADAARALVELRDARAAPCRRALSASEKAPKSNVNHGDESWPVFARRVSRACGGLAFAVLGPFASALKARQPMGEWTDAGITSAFADWQEQGGSRDKGMGAGVRRYRASARVR